MSYEIPGLQLPLAIIDEAEQQFYDTKDQFGTDAGVRAAAWVGFKAGAEAAANAIEAHAESIGWHEGGGTWADVIEKARGVSR